MDMNSQNIEEIVKGVLARLRDDTASNAALSGEIPRTS